MADLEEYIQRVLDDEDNVLLAEASDCLLAGAHRAAYITIWLATAESLRRKFREAAVRDGQAGAILAQIQQLEDQHKAVDGVLIKKAKEYGFITDAEATRLQHLYENRNVFGHPYEQRPSEQLVRTAASEAVDIVLGRPVALREGYLSQQVNRITSDTTFLSDDEDAVMEYAQVVHGRSAADRRIWFLRKLFSALDGVFADPSTDRLQRRGIWFVRAFLEADLNILNQWDAVDDLPDHRRVLAVVLAVDSIFGQLSVHAQDIVVNVLLQEASTDSSYLRMVDELSKAGVLRQVHQAGLDRVIDEFPRRRLFASDLPLRTYFRRVIETLTTYSWDAQNEAIPALGNAGPTGVGDLANDDQENLGRNVMQAAEGNAWAAIDFLDDLAITSPQWPPAFVRGVVMEPFANEAGELRLKTRQMVRALLGGLRAVPEDDRPDLVREIIDAIRSGQPRIEWEFRRDRDRATAALREMTDQSDLAMLADIADALDAVPVDDLD